ncbi:3,4-dihydroxy-2-butanone-4-phosphate synthase, partial [Pasteurella multocida]
MNQSILSPFGQSEERAIAAINAFKQGNGVLVLDDEDRENEGDLIFPAETITVEQMTMLIRYGSG